MLGDNTCPICLEAGQQFTAKGGDDDFYDCRCIRCGNFKITGSAKVTLLNSTDEIKESSRANISGWLREHPANRITSYDLTALLELKNPSVAEKALKLLREIDKKCSVVGERISIKYDEKSWWPISWSFSEREISYLLNDYLVSQGLLIGTTNTSTGMYKVSPAGYAYLQRIRETNEGSHIGFCAMWFDSQTTNLWAKGIEPGTRSAGYQPFRIDKHDHVNRIDDEIMASIRRSKFCVADFTHGEGGARGGVYFEAGFALGIGLPVIWTCRKDFIKEQKIHFDVRQYNFLEWEPEDLGDFADRLRNRIESIFGHGSYTQGSKA